MGGTRVAGGQPFMLTQGRASVDGCQGQNGTIAYCEGEDSLMLPTVALGVKPSPFWPQQSTGPNAKLYPFLVPACPG